jgi:hypothetical protein
MIMSEKTPATPPTAKAAKSAAAPAKTDQVKKTRVRKDYAPLDLTTIQAVPVSRELLVKHRNTKGEREPEQIAVDKLVNTAYKRWVEAGKPQAWLESDTGYLMKMPKEQVETFMYRVRKAGTYYDVAIRFGKVLEDEDGKSLVLFIAKDRPVKDEESGESENASEAS